MKTLYLDCGMGAAGDMLASALLELLDDPQSFVQRLNALDIPDVEYTAQRAEKCGIFGTHLCVRVHGTEEYEHMHHAHEHEHSHDHEHDHDHEHEHEHSHEHEHDHEHHHPHVHRGLAEIRAIVDGLALPESVRADVLAVYDRLAAAESRVHGVEVEQIHFHEVGSMDALADITAVCLLLHTIKPDRILASPVHVGSGHVHCAHGILPVPAPATALLLEGVPIYGGAIAGELCTPTGAALLRHFVQRFGDMPTLLVSRIGYGMGQKDFERANCVRALLGESAQSADDVLELSCSVDDMTAEEIAFACAQIMEGGALDVYTTAIGMKKSRPGTCITVLCRPQDRETCLGLLFRHTATIGVRECAMHRAVLRRTVQTVATPYGDVRVKTAEGFGVTKKKIEYEDLARIAREQGRSLAEVRALLETEGIEE